MPATFMTKAEMEACMTEARHAKARAAVIDAGYTLEEWRSVNNPPQYLVDRLRGIYRGEEDDNGDAVKPDGGSAKAE